MPPQNKAPKLSHPLKPGLAILAVTAVGFKRGFGQGLQLIEYPMSQRELSRSLFLGRHPAQLLQEKRSLILFRRLQDCHKKSGSFVSFCHLCLCDGILRPVGRVNKHRAIAVAGIALHMTLASLCLIGRLEPVLLLSQLLLVLLMVSLLLLLLLLALFLLSCI